MRKSNLRFLCLAAAATLIMGGCSGSTDSGETVAVQSVSMLAGLNAGLQNRYAGKVVPLATQEVKKDDQKTVKEVFVKEGDEVTVGQVLFSYDMEEASLNIEQGKLELEKMRNSIETTKSQITALEKERKQAASSDKLSYTIEIQTLEADIRQTEYNISTKEVEIDRLEKSMEKSEVTAEMNGVVQSISENGYDNYGNAKPYMTIMETGTYRIEGNISELNARSLPVGSSVVIRSRVDENETWSGTLDSVDLEHAVSNQNDGYYYVSSSSSEMTNTTKYPFYVTLDDSSGLMMGQHVYIELGTEDENVREGIWLSSYYIVQDGNDAYVWAATDQDKLEKRTVSLGEHDEDTDEYQITDGLTASDYIAIPEEGLSAGQPVTRYDEGYFGGSDTVDTMGGEYNGGAGGEYVEGADGEYIGGMDGESPDANGEIYNEGGISDGEAGDSASYDGSGLALPEGADGMDGAADGAGSADGEITEIGEGVSSGAASDSAHVVEESQAAETEAGE